MVIALIIAIILAVVSTLLAASETAVLMLAPGRIHRLAEADRRGGRALDMLADDRHRLRAVRELVAALAYAAAGFTGVLAGLEVGWATAVVTGAVSVLVCYSVTQALPRTLAVTNPERVALDSAPFTHGLIGVIYPVARVLVGPWKWAISLTGAERPFSPWAVTPEWRGTLDSDTESEREGAEEALLEAVSDFADKVVREVMVPRTDMHALQDTASVADAVNLISTTGVSRVPVYSDTIDDICGVLFAKDLLAALHNSEDVSLAALVREPYFVPETKPVEELLREMRTRTHIAIVADEYGGTSGLVTLEDLLEEIVGDIADEYDREEALIEDLGRGRFRVDARLPVDDLNEAFGTDLDTDADSVGGLFTQAAGRIPELNESVEFEGLRLVVTELEGTRIRQLLVESAPREDKGAHDA